MPVAKPKLNDDAELLPRRDAGRGADAMNPNRAVTLAEAAEMLGITEAYVAYLVNQGTIPHHMVGRHSMVERRDVLAFKKEKERRNKIMDEIVARDQEMGLC